MAEPLLTPRNGLPELVSTEKAFKEIISELEGGFGPIAIDAERASGFRYFPRAYLIQINRRGGGLHLIDPVAIGSTNLWQEINKTFSETEWVIHASTQDLPCLRELGIDPQDIFDTELGGRIAGCERVGLGPLCEALLDIQLAKEHSAVDWSARPLREEWLNYAALDVEVLIDLRDAVEKLLIDQDKLKWARQEFKHVLTLDLTPEKTDPWRRTSGMHKMRNREALGLVKFLWETRNGYARQVDIAPGRIFNDETLMELVSKRPQNLEDFRKIILKKTRHQDLPVESWYEKYLIALDTPQSQLPPMRGSGTGLPAIKIWEEKNPSGYARATHARAAVANRATELNLPSENLLAPDILRRLCWPEPPANQSEYHSYIESFLLDAGARRWQVSALDGLLDSALAAREPLILPKAEDEAGITQQ